MVGNETRGQRARRVRVERGLTQAQLSEATGVAIKTIADFENDKRNTHADKAAAILAYLDIPGDPEETLADFPLDVLAIGDIVMGYLDTLTPAARREWSNKFIREITGKNSNNETAE